MDVRLNRPDRLSFLKLRLGGVDLGSLDRSVLGSGRQRLEGGMLEVRREKVTHRASYVLPYKDVSGAMKSYLGPELNVESDHPSILHKAREILSGTKDPVRAVRKLNQWVYRPQDPGGGLQRARNAAHGAPSRSRCPRQDLPRARGYQR